MKYFEMKQKHQHEVDEFPIMFAFSRDQFKEGMERLGVTDAKKELFSIGASGFIRKTDSDALEELFTRHEEEMESAMADKQFMIDAIEYELGNHEYCITYDPTQTVELLNLDIENPVHVECFNTARRQYLAYANA